MRAALTRFIGSARWFGGKGRELQVTDVRRLRVPGGSTDDLELRLELATVTYAGGDTDVYQLPLSYYREWQPQLEHAHIGEWDDEELGHVYAYDALHDHDAAPLLLAGFASGAANEDMTFTHLEGHQLDTRARSSLFSGEQSNSSVAFGEDSLMKVFRKLQPGRNPDIVIHAALTRAGSDHVAALYGHLETTAMSDTDDEPTHLAMLQQFLRTASDGWDLALASVRGLMAELDKEPGEVGGDFASECHRLGIAIAEVHAALAEAFPTQVWGREDLAALADAMSQRLDDAVEVVPQLTRHAAALRATYDALRVGAETTEPVVAQRVHGDLHLGQTLRTVKGWKLVDFEGEPAKPLTDRVLPDSPWRDVAGMLRSFDYAAHAVEVDVEGQEGTAELMATRAVEWAARNRNAFLEGYSTVHGAADRVLLRAYEVDKAVYETVYETRNRPDWLAIPLAAIRRLSA